MKVNGKHSDDGKLLTISINNRFDFSVYDELSKSYEHSTAKSAVVDSRGVEYMDSSALGMLLVMREHFGSRQDSIKLTNCSKEILDILGVANFRAMFLI